MADEPDHLVGLLTGMPFSTTAEEVTDVTTGEVIKVEDFKVPPVKVARTKTKPSKPEYQPFKW